MSSYLDYVRGGEFLIAPSINYKDQYILKCCECDEYYEQLESFYAHCIGHYQSRSNDDDGDCSLDDVNNDDCNMSDGIIEDTTLKCENFNETEGEDPLTPIEWDCASGTTSLIVKEEPKYGCLEMDDLEHDESEPEEESSSDVPDDTNSEIVESNTVTSETKPIKSGSFVREFMKTKLNVTTLIEAYKKQPKLWNSNIPNIKTQERNSILQDISKELRDQVNADLSYAQVAAIIAHMRYTYRAKMKRMQTTDKPIVQTWYMQHLNFLVPFMENTNSTVAVNVCQTELPRKHLTQILGIYKRHPYLWNTDLAEYCCENKRIKAFEDMLNDIESEMSLTINQQKLKEYIDYIHNCVAKSKHRNIISDKAESSAAAEYYTHMKFLYDHVGPFKCNECGRKLKNALAFKVHKSHHDGLMPLICSICNKEFKLIVTYTSHVRRHMEDLKDACKECGKKFLNSYDLKIHMRCHTGDKPFCCELCGTSFRHIQTFASHKRRHEQNYLHKCPLCSKGFYTKAKHDDHVRSHKNIREFICKTCGKAFKTKKTLLQHEVIHDDARKHACPLCGKTFKLKVGVIQHMKTHGSNIEKNSTMD